jgi:hypothetical protein
VAIRVVVDHPGAGLRRLGRGIVVLFGVLLVTAGLVAVVLPLLFLVFVVTMPVSGASWPCPMETYQDCSPVPGSPSWRSSWDYG